MQQWGEFDKTGLMPSLFESYDFLDAELNNRLEKIANYFGENAEFDIEPNSIRLYYKFEF